MDERPGVKWTWNRWKAAVIIGGLLVWAFVIKVIIEIIKLL